MNEWQLLLRFSTDSKQQQPAAVRQNDHNLDAEIARMRGCVTYCLD
jgi:hypothetical protein